MSERFSASDFPELSAAEKTRLQAEVGAETQSACSELASECADDLNQTPEGRLQLVCAEENLPLSETDPATLLENRHLQVAFSRPLPMPPRIRERCVGILCEALGQSSQAPEAPVTEAVAVKQATLETAMEGETAVETREADIDAAIESEQSANAVRAHRNDGLNKTLSDVTTERDAATAHADAETARGETATAHADAEAERADANSAEVQNFIRELPRGKLHEYRQRATEQLPTKAQRDLAETHFAKYEAELAALQTVFTPQEVQQVFGGNLTETVTLNLASQSKADVYRDVFARIDAGIADEDRRREVRAKVAGQLSREWNTFKALCMTGHEEGLS